MFSPSRWEATIPSTSSERRSRHSGSLNRLTLLLDVAIVPALEAGVAVNRKHRSQSTANRQLPPGQRLDAAAGQRREGVSKRERSSKWHASHHARAEHYRTAR